MKRLARVFFSLLILVSIGAVYSWDSIVPVIQQVNESDTINLVAITNYITEFFKHAEAWNLIFLALFFSLVIVILAAVDYGLSYGLKWASEKWKVVKSITNSNWFWPIQKGVSGLIVFVLFIISSNLFVAIVANQSTAESVTEIKGEAQPVLLLGTSKILSSGNGENLYYRYRIEAVKELYDAGKLKYVVISGDKSNELDSARVIFQQKNNQVPDSSNYDETRDMTLDLIEVGIPASLIEIDTAGYRTLDSMLRLRQLFKMNDVIIVSQEFHTQRALFLSWFYSINAIAYPAKGTSNMAMVKREVVGAKPKVILDLLFFNTMPKTEAFAYREDFTLGTNGSVGAVISLFIAVFASFWLLVRLLENRTKGILKLVTFSVVGIAGTILCAVSVYSNTEIEFVDKIVESISANTGLLKETVETKKTKKEAIKTLEASIEQSKSEESIQLARISTLVQSIVETANESDEVDSLTLFEDVITGDDLKNIELRPSMVGNQISPPTEKESQNDVMVNNDIDETIDEPAEEEKESKNKLLKSVIRNKNLSASDEIKEKEPVIKFISVKVHGTQILEHDKAIKFRLNESLTIKQANLNKNKVFQSRANIYNNYSWFEISKMSVYNIQSSIYSNKEIKGIPLKSLSKDKKGNYILSDGMELFLAITE
ncbi:MAG: ElyC/SanA/YdcF family protein [Bacteroidota bacterium]